MITEEEYKAAIQLIYNYHLQQEEKLETPQRLQDLYVSTRTYTILKREFGMYFPLQRFKDVKKTHLMMLRGFGEVCLKELEEDLANRNITLQ